MRKGRLVLLLIIFLITTAILVVIYQKRRPRPPTPFNWTAYVSTLAGDGAPLFREAAQPTQAGFSDPFGVAIGADGSIYISDAGESNRIRKLTPEGNLVTLAGSTEGFADGTPGSFNSPSGIDVDSSGNIYVADTGNNRIRKITPEGVVSTVAGNGTAGYVDGPATSAQFDGPIGVAVDPNGVLYIADTYNDRIRRIGIDGQVTTVAGAGRPGYVDGDSTNALFDTPCALVIGTDGTLIVADTGNDKLRKISATGQVSTVSLKFEHDANRTWIGTPTSLVVTHDGFLYVTEMDRGAVLQIKPDGSACEIAGNGPGYFNGARDVARFNHPTGIAIDRRTGDLVVADSSNYLIRKISATDTKAASSAEVLPRLTPETLGERNLPWPLDLQDRPHEVVATMGEVRGSYDSTDSRHHLHSGLDVFGAYGDVVRAIRSEKVTSPLPNWGFDELSEGLSVGVIKYIHMHVGRDKDSKTFDDPRFKQVKGDDGKLTRMRIRRGTRFRPGDAVGTVNRMYHVHLIVGPSGAEVNPLFFSPIGFKDTIQPIIEKDGVQLFDESGRRLTEKDNDKLVVRGRLRIVVDAFDRSDMNPERRRLGLYSLGYQVFNFTAAVQDNKQSPAKSNPAVAATPNPAPGFAERRVTILFNRLPPDDATKLVYAAESGITVYGSKTTRFLYELTNTVRDGHARAGLWDASELPKGDYVLRITLSDFSGNETHQDVSIMVK
jgi:sugar lactone lactonase YvrE